MEVILLEDVKSLGKKGEVVKVNDGYARNFILPKKLGVEKTDKTMHELKLQKAAEAKRAQELLEEAQALAKQIEAGKIQQVFSLQFGYTLYNKPGLKLPRGTNWNEADYYAVPSWMVKCVYLPNGKKNMSDEVNALLKK